MLPTVLLIALVLGTSVWVGGYVAIVVVARAATAALEPSARVQFFRRLGRSYVWVGLPALVVALACGAVLVREHPWDAVLVSTTVVAVALLVLLAVAIVQAKRMTRLRRRALASPDDAGLAARVRRGGRAAATLRAVLGVLSLVLVVLGSVLAG